LPLIALDAMGGDNAPDAIVAGALDAVQQLDVSIALIGNRSVLDTYGIDHPKITLIHAPDVILMDDPPLQAFRKKKESSIHVGLTLVKEGKADAFLSAGNTGAIMSCALFILGRIKGIDRPALASVIPTNAGCALMLDMGSNVDSKPINLEQYAIMGHFFSINALGVPHPRIGLINIGEEKEKGNQLTHDTYARLESNTKIQFIGNLEGKDILNHKADVIVCDGFIGNTLLKFGEGLVDYIFHEIKSTVASGSLATKIGGWLLTPAFRALKKKIDYEEYGGAPLLGVNGVALVAHGKSKKKAVVSAIRTAMTCVNNRMISKMAIAFDTDDNQ
jgi:glycerol-3-phosphate acyltransferase PlsX